MATIETKRITELPVAASVSGTEAIPLVQDSVTKQTTLQTIADQMLVGPPGAQGGPGADGIPGPIGATGPIGPGVVAGGSAGQLLSKIDGTDYNTQWVTPPTGVSPTQTGEAISGLIVTPADGDYKIVVKTPHGGTITETTTISASGTCTLTFKINTTALGGTANSVSSSEQSQAHASANTFVAGDDIVLSVSSNSSCSKMTFTIKYTRMLS